MTNRVPKSHALVTCLSPSYEFNSYCQNPLSSRIKQTKSKIPKPTTFKILDKSINILIYVLFLLWFCKRIRFKKGLLLYFSDFQLFCALRRFLRENQLFGGILAQDQLEMKANILKFNL